MTRMVIALAALWSCSNGPCATAQSPAGDTLLSAACIELNNRVVAQIVDGRAAAAESTLAAGLSDETHGLGSSCAGTIWNNAAVMVSATGRLFEAAGLAERSIRAFLQVYPADNPVFLPLQLLAAVRFELGETAMARDAFRKIHLIRIERPADKALFHGISASLLEADGKLTDAEIEYVAAIRAWQDAGRGESAGADVITGALGTLYLKEGRLNDAKQALDAAVAILARAADVFPTDRVWVLNSCGVMRARRAEWGEAEQDLRQALSIADEQPQMDAATLLPLLANYAAVLHQNHRRRNAHLIEVRIGTLQRSIKMPAVVDKSELLVIPERCK